jgi:GT2 family glycosyltransferase
MRLSALIANYQSGAHALAAARSLAAEWTRLGLARERLEIVVADDASPPGEYDWLERLEAEGCRVLRRGERGGYAAAIGDALAATQGGPDDVVAALNADLWFLPGSLAPCLAALAEERDLGAVAPRCVSDPAAALELPPQDPPTPAGERAALRSAVDRGRTRLAAQARARAALAVWSAHGRLEREMLSGACLFLRREWIERAGGLLDARYPLYFEDTDLCRRLRAAGARLAQCREAAVVHFWARSTGLGADFERVVGERFRASRRRYYTRWHGTAELEALEAAEAAWSVAPPAPAAAHDFAPLGELAAAPSFAWQGRGPFLIEFGLGADLRLAAGALGHGAQWSLPEASWQWLHAARWFVRALERDTLACLGAWTFDKTDPARRDPHTLEPEGERDARAA